MRSVFIVCFLMVGCKTTNISSTKEDGAPILSDKAFVRIPAGKFMMGSPESEPNRGRDELLHKVEISRSFMMMTKELTVNQWYAGIGTNPEGDFEKENRQRPKASVTWIHVQDFIKKLNGGVETCGDTKTLSGFKKAVVTRGCYRLPTEAEWEYAARAGTTTAFNIGDKVAEYEVNFIGYDNTTRLTGNENNYRHSPVQVGYYRNKNAWGLFDMHGNVSEMTQDWYGEDYYSNSPAKDPVGPLVGKKTVIRGGDCHSFYNKLRSAGRDSIKMYDPNDTSAWGNHASFSDTVGFRLVKTL